MNFQQFIMVLILTQDLLIQKYVVKAGMVFLFSKQRRLSTFVTTALAV